MRAAGDVPAADVPLGAEAEQSQGVGDHHQRASLVEHDRQADPGQPEQRAGDQCGDHAQTAMTRFWRMIRRVCRLSATTNGSRDKSSAIRATSAVSRATSLPPAPMAIPTEAVVKAGASFTPSPTMATPPCLAINSRTAASFCSGNRPDRYVADPHLLGRGGRHVFVVAGEHDQGGDTEGPQGVERFGGGLAHPVGQAEHADDLIVPLHQHRRSPVRLDVPHAGADGIGKRIGVIGREQIGAADPHGPATDAGLNALTGDGTRLVPPRAATGRRRGLLAVRPWPAGEPIGSPRRRPD